MSHKLSFRSAAVILAGTALLLCLSGLHPNHALAKRKPTPPPPEPVSYVEAATDFLRTQIGPVGLLDSYVEDNADYSYTYDNALAAMAFISAGDLDSARTILDAFARIGPDYNGGFVHRYNSIDGQPVEGIAGVGHNAYLLQAVNLYYLETHDPRYNNLASTLAAHILSYQDSDGGLFGRPSVSWKSAENNLAGYCALNNLGVNLGISAYKSSAALIKNFLITECWDGSRFLTGENDTMIVTDVQALGTLILGADYSNGSYWIQPHTLTTRRYDRRKSITGFDMNTDKDTVWTEGTLQQSLAYLLAGDLPKSNAFRSEAEKLFQGSGALRQASNTGTSGFGDTFQPWQAVAPTAWYIFVHNQDNPFEILK
ncbi:MAG: hypothetical protein JW937_01660 [Candidatus Omnitrophica bacterium]|nr:hypothetical protein [Candidatus Omnitrophota bacterium]